MQKENVIFLRDTLKGKLPNAKLRVTCDNMMLFDESKDVIHWDDDKGVVVVIRHTDDYARDASGEFEVFTTEYEMIQYITLDCGRLSVERSAGEIGLNEELMAELKQLVHDATHIVL